jgi:hypothetical protein
MSKALAETEIFTLLRQKNILLQTPGCEEKVKLLDLSISRLQQAQGATSGIYHEEEKVELESLENLIVEDREIPTACEAITGATEKAFNLLLARRDAAYSQAIASLETEREKLEGEAVSLTEASANLGELLPAKMRVARAEADELLVQGRTAEAHRKIAEAQEAANAPAQSEARQSAIRERLSAIEAEKRNVGRRIFGEWHRECQSVVRASEHALFLVLLDGLKQSFFDFEQSTGTSAQAVGDPGLFGVGHLDSLTAPENSVEWNSGNRWYGGRR